MLLGNLAAEGGLVRGDKGPTLSLSAFLGCVVISDLHPASFFMSSVLRASMDALSYSCYASIFERVHHLNSTAISSLGVFGHLQSYSVNEAKDA